MIIANFKFEGETITARVPSNWDEIKVKHYLALETTKNPLELLALLADTDLTKILNTSTDLTPVLNKAIELLNQAPPDYRTKPRRRIVIDGKAIKIPDNFNAVTFGQSSLIQQYITQADGDERKAIAQVMAVILQPLINKGPFDLDKAADLERKILDKPIIEVLPNVFFFWTVLKNYLIIGQIN